MKKLVILALITALCLTATGCGGAKEPAPDQLQTPQYSVSPPEDFTPPPEDEIHTASDGVKVIAPSMAPETATAKSDIAEEAESAASSVVAYQQIPAVITPETIWDEDAVVTYNAFTLPEKAAFDDGNIGVLSIEKIGLTVNVYESDDQMEDMSRGLAHFKSTSAWDGNCALSGHNSTASGYGAYFKDLHLLVAGDTVTYRTALGERDYKVTAVKTIGDEDWSGLSRSPDNMLTLITCTFNDASKRLMVRAIQA